MQEVQNTQVVVFTLRNGKVTDFQEFTNSAVVNAAYAVGGEPI